jgi:S1-C subfamily serine protease
MRHAEWFLTAVLSLGMAGADATPGSASGRSSPPGRGSAAGAVVERVKPAVVVIRGTRDKGKDKVSGLGIVIDARGLVLINHHAIDGMEGLEATLRDGRKLAAKVVFADPKLDIAIVAVASSTPLPHAELADSDRVEEGDWVLALGPPLGESFTVVRGIVSAKIGVLKNGATLLRVDTAVGPGLSGGPLIDMKGKVVGLVAGGAARRGAGDCAIPSNRITPLVALACRKP